MDIMDIIDRIIRKLDRKPYNKILPALYFFEAGILFEIIVRGENLIFTIPLVLCIIFGIAGMAFIKS